MTSAIGKLKQISAACFRWPAQKLAPRSPRARRWLKRITVACGILLVVSAAGLMYGWHRMTLADQQHASFCASGTSIKGFLKKYAAAVKQAVDQHDASGLLVFYDDDFRSPQRGHWSLRQPRDLGEATLRHLDRVGEEELGRDAVVAELQQYVDGIESIDSNKLKINLIEEIDPEVRAVLTVKYVVDGRDREGQLFQDRFFFRWHVEKQPGSAEPDDWRIVRDELVDGVRVAGQGKTFERVDLAAAGIDYVHRRDPKLNKLDPNVHLKFAVIEHASGGMSAVDYDADGRCDLFFADGQQSRLYRNVTPPGASDVTFVDVTSRAGLDGLGAVNAVIFADVDNDADVDCFVSRYMTACKFYRNDGSGYFVDATSEVGLDLVAPCVSVCCLDYDRDGFLDLYVAVNGHAAVAAPDIPFYATNGMPNRLLHNVGGKKFVDVTEASGTGCTGWTLAVTAGDYDGDGDPDIAVANDFGRKCLYENNGDGTFTDRARDAGVLDFSGGMGVAFADLNGDDFPDLLTSNIESGQRWFGEEVTLWQFMRNEVRSGWIWDDLAEYRELYGLLGDDWRDLGKQVGEGNSVFCNQGDRTFVEWKDCNATRAGWAWSVNPLDFDNDGDLDIYVANGWVSGKLKDDL